MDNGAKLNGQNTSAMKEFLESTGKTVISSILSTPLETEETIQSTQDLNSTHTKLNRDSLAQEQANKKINQDLFYAGTEEDSAPVENGEVENDSDHTTEQELPMKKKKKHESLKSKDEGSDLDISFTDRN